MIIAGLTGSLGAGKTTALRMFEDCGAAVIDTDRMVHEFLGPKGKCVTAVKKKFPQAFEGGEIQRKALAQMVFGHPRKLKALEDILHPVVRREVKKRVKEISAKKRARMIVVDVPLLFEAGFEDLFDVVLVVRADRVNQTKRLRKSRGMTSREVRFRLKRQMPQSEKLKRADFVIDNRSTKARTRAQVRRIWDGLVSHRN